uniref:RING-type domain-containing protein n=1 Tax=viral metagenome TaxID=1070528 RepID=A0A6C0M0U6_9ZZZZ
MNRPEECPTCYESLSNEEHPLSCGHWIHMNCIRMGHKAECHLCRAPIANVQVVGSLPPNDLRYSESSEGTRGTPQSDSVVYIPYIPRLHDPTTMNMSTRTVSLCTEYENCPECKKEVIESGEGYHVCTSCGLCLDRIIVY